MHTNTELVKTVGELSICPTAKAVAMAMKLTGITNAKELAALLNIPERTVYRSKNEIAIATDGTATTANAATSGTATTATSGNPQKEIPPTPPKENNNNIITLGDNNTPPREDVLRGVDLKILSERLREAGKGCLDPNAGNLQVMSTPIGWMQDGADLEIDILPTLRAAAVDKKGAMIRSWNYFDRMIAKAKADRSRKLPDVPETNIVPMPRQSERSARTAAFMAALKSPRVEVLS